ncbi:MAG: hypothetical protein VKM34_07540 [Cyanobacteriota bacterium]|nr:hypothetical protein [Cyanobacteriota bacterium]
MRRSASLPAAVFGLGCVAAICLGAAPARAGNEPAKLIPTRGVEEVTSVYSEVEACNLAQRRRPQGAVVTNMQYWRVGRPGEWATTCLVEWSTSKNARPTGRPILFGPTN